ncbi:hypothetical protein [Halostagnicola sp. A56]|uniref:hypothetical protein n=1 Tax=Halostagnicola sp. A56 TaxID=1495067 RepID=UPI00049F945E|nr:hypothetical protein [Halostagnicola sp. A56]
MIGSTRIPAVVARCPSRPRANRTGCDAAPRSDVLCHGPTTDPTPSSTPRSDAVAARELLESILAAAKRAVVRSTAVGRLESASKPLSNSYLTERRVVTDAGEAIRTILERRVEGTSVYVRQVTHSNQQTDTLLSRGVLDGEPTGISRRIGSVRDEAFRSLTYLFLRANRPV